MNNDQWEQFLDRLVDLYPGRLNGEQVRVWKSYILSLPTHEADSTLSKYFADVSSSTLNLQKFRQLYRQLYPKNKTANGGGTPRAALRNIERGYWWNFVSLRCGGCTERERGFGADRAYEQWCAFCRRHGFDYLEREEADVLAAEQWEQEQSRGAAYA